MEGNIEQEDMNLLKWLSDTEYVLLVDSAVELQNIFHNSSAKSLSPLTSPNWSKLLKRPKKVYNIMTKNLFETTIKLGLRPRFPRGYQWAPEGHFAEYIPF